MKAQSWKEKQAKASRNREETGSWGFDWGPGRHLTKEAVKSDFLGRKVERSGEPALEKRARRGP